MTIFGVIYGAVLVIVGVFGYFKSGGESVTALIPAFLGSPVVFLSMLSLNPKYLNKHTKFYRNIILSNNNNNDIVSTSVVWYLTIPKSTKND